MLIWSEKDNLAPKQFKEDYGNEELEKIKRIRNLRGGRSMSILPVTTSNMLIPADKVDLQPVKNFGHNKRSNL